MSASLWLIALLSSDVSAQIDAGAADDSGDGGTSGTTGLGPSDFAFFTEEYDPGQRVWVRQNAVQQQYFFNRARCECVDAQGDGSGSNYSGYFRIAIEPGSGTAQKIQALLAANAVPSGAGRLYAGSLNTDCLSPSVRGDLAQGCTNLLDPNDLNAEFPLTVFEIQRLWESPPIPVSRLFGSWAQPTCGSTGTCDQPSGCNLLPIVQVVYFWAQTNSGGSPDSSTLAFPLYLDGQVDLAPSGLTVESGDEALVASWSWPSQVAPSGDPNLLGIQLFCQRGADSQVFPTSTFSASYLQSAVLCPSIAPTGAQPSAFSNQSPVFLCSDLLPLTTYSHRITGLQNGVAYGVGVAAVDRYGNLSPITPSEVVYGIPGAGVDGGPSDDGVSVGGGSCTLSSGRRGLGSLASLALMGMGVLFLGRKRRSRRSD